MNPWALLLVLVGVVVIIVGVKGTQHGIAGALTGHAVSTPGGTSTMTPSGSSGKAGKSGQ